MLVLLVLAGCAATPAQRDVGQREMQRISDEMRRMEGVTEVEPVYQTAIAAYGYVGVRLTVRPGTPAEPLLDTLERLVWTSDLDPLGSISLSVRTQDADPAAMSVQRAYATDAEQEALASKYGPRPVR